MITERIIDNKTRQMVGANGSVICTITAPIGFRDQTALRDIEATRNLIATASAEAEKLQDVVDAVAATIDPKKDVEAQKVLDKQAALVDEKQAIADDAADQLDAKITAAQITFDNADDSRAAEFWSRAWDGVPLTPEDEPGTLYVFDQSQQLWINVNK